MLRVLLAASLPLLLVGGIWLGGHPDHLPGFVRESVVQDRDGQLLDEALEVIADDYYRPVNRRRVVNSAIGAAVDSLEDRFSAYFDPKAYTSFEESTSGAFEGVGMTVDAVKRGLEVVSVFPGSPAQQGGLRVGEVITHVDGTALAGKTVVQSTTLIKGPAGTSVRMTVRDKRGHSRELRLERRRVEVPVVQAELETQGGIKVAHVRLDSFTSGAHGEVGKAVRTLLGRGAKGVILDLRHNGGGLLNEAVLVASIFIPEGTIVTTRGRSRPERVFEAAGRSIDKDVPVVVLVDGASASASEIVTGALQDRKRATVVGTRTFGKGVFQEITRLSNGGALDLTVGEYFTPSGRNLGPRKGAKGGIEPDVHARDDEDTDGRDEALETALRTVVRGAA